MLMKLFKRKKKVRVNQEILAIMDVLVADILHVNRTIEKQYNYI